MPAGGQQAPLMVPIAMVHDGSLWCSCAFAMPEAAMPERCPGCDRSTVELLAEAAYNAEVTAYVESLPLNGGLPGLTESGASWWQRMAAAFEASKTEGMG